MRVSDEIEIDFLTDNEEQATIHFQDAMSAIWDERPELQSRPKEVWMKVYTDYINDHDRYEVTVYDDGVLLGVAVASVGDDTHVANALEVLVMYVVPEYRNTGAVRKLLVALLDLARGLEVNYLCTTQYKGNGTYVGKYHKVRK